MTNVVYLDQRRRQKLDPDEAFYKAQYEHDGFYTRQENNYKELEIALKALLECINKLKRSLE